MVANQNRETGVRLGQTLRAARERLGLTQLDLAIRLGVERTTVAGWESGRRIPDVPTLERLQAVLGLTPGQLLRPPQNATTAVTAKTISPEEQLRQLRAMLRGLGATDEDVQLILHVLRVRQQELRQTISREEKGAE